eukprot:gnl/MRDRNA2_/MRDRNA2_198701_c0_seq1.p1 gnl/MRDRNA2_/MRDRNA2_198701_c0~~gnl/MRDRNA2_/MRDRNA2_198701_c0_seq1.p1  ORF type:complete len:289 (-),score=47.53 gnl/MRDRNA2_/MRDRNA2_198701_c0_seq1:173-1039(-)
MASPDVTLLLVPGSPYVMKAMSALQSRQIAFDTHWCDLASLRTQLPPPHKVPVMVCNGEVIADSTYILKYIDTALASEQEPLFSGADVAALEHEISEVLSAYIYFFIFIDIDGWKQGMEKVLAKQIPGPLLCMGYTPSKAASKKRLDIKQQVSQLLGADVGESDGAVVMASGVGPLLQKYEDCLAKQRFLCGTSLPSAADCALYGILERVVGVDERAGGDTGMVAVVPQLLQPYPNLQNFYATMRTTYPIPFKGRRRSPEKPKLPLPGLYQKAPLVPQHVWETMCTIM